MFTTCIRMTILTPSSAPDEQGNVYEGVVQYILKLARHVVRENALLIDYVAGGQGLRLVGAATKGRNTLSRAQRSSYGEIQHFVSKSQKPKLSWNDGFVHLVKVPARQIPRNPREPSAAVIPPDAPDLCIEISGVYPHGAARTRMRDLSYSPRTQQSAIDSPSHKHARHRPTA